MGEEIFRQLGPSLDVFCAAVGTAGLLVGVSRALKASGCPARIVALEPAESPLLSTGTGGAHHVEGIGVGFWPPHLHEGDYDEILPIKEIAAREMARRLAKEEGLLAGTSTGLNVAAAVQLAAALGPEATVVTVACDSGLKYLAGDLYSG